MKQSVHSILQPVSYESALNERSFPPSYLSVTNDRVLGGDGKLVGVWQGGLVKPHELLAELSNLR